MLTTIVWGTDGSENAVRALPYARALLSDGAMLIAVYIVQDHPSHRPDRPAATQLDAVDIVANLRNLVTEASEQGTEIAPAVANRP